MVLIVAKCIVNKEINKTDQGNNNVLIVAKCIVNCNNPKFKLKVSRY